MNNIYRYINFNDDLGKVLSGNDADFKTDEDLDYQSRVRSQEIGKKRKEATIAALKAAANKNNWAASVAELTRMGIDPSKFNNKEELNKYIRELEKGSTNLSGYFKNKKAKKFINYIKNNHGYDTANAYNKERKARFEGRKSGDKAYDTNSHGYTRKDLEKAHSIMDDPNATDEQKEVAREFYKRNAGLSEKSILTGGVKKGQTMRSMDDVATAQETIRSNSLTHNQVKELNKASRNLISKRHQANLDRSKNAGEGFISRHTKHGISHAVAQAGNFLANKFGAKDGIIADNLSRLGRAATQVATRGEGRAILDADPYKDEALKEIRSKELGGKDPNTSYKRTEYKPNDRPTMDDVMHSEPMGINGNYELFSADRMKKFTEMDSNAFPNPVNLNNTIQGKLSIGEYKDINNYRLSPNVMSLDDIESWLKSPGENLY